jgi:hypothetical protein
MLFLGVSDIWNLTEWRSRPTLAGASTASVQGQPFVLLQLRSLGRRERTFRHGAFETMLGHGGASFQQRSVLLRRSLKLLAASLRGLPLPSGF